jgi:RNA polymerase sigma factor (sigma-70 family)
MATADRATLSEIGALYRDQHGWLCGWLRRRLGCSDVAADLAQDTFIRLLTREEPVPIRDSRLFLSTVAYRVMCNHFRRQKLERAYMEALASLPEALVPSPEEQLIAIQTLLELDRALEGLDMAVRKAFLWSQVDRISHEEIAGRLGVSVTTVKRYIVKAGTRCFFLD